MSVTVKPTKAELAAAVGSTITDVIAPGLRVLFVGINPGLYSGWTGYHFARPGNRFWPTLHAAGFTPRQLAPAEQQELLRCGCGVTNFVARATARADELSAAELADGGQRLERLVAELQPQSVAVLGITAYRAAYARPQAQMGRQAEPISGCPVWALPNPSGLNAHYTLASLADVFRAFRLELEAELA